MGISEGGVEGLSTYQQSDQSYQQNCTQLLLPNIHKGMTTQMSLSMHISTLPTTIITSIYNIKDNYEH